jgi:hypothetical protein
MLRRAEDLRDAALFDLAPRYITSTRSAISATTPMSWVMKITPMFRSRCSSRIS